ncbi:hypothetical protein [Herminiimonas sp. CN]|uniref:hypothetical protein n=1 Tax=Herminiimonas sp. CN TaxID=1349818 RepID=UPI00047356D4|nr:hypothetical protein [Herminiimonas sp. CN]
MNTLATLNDFNARRTANVLQKFNRPEQSLLNRAYGHLIASRLGMTLMVPVGAISGRLVPVLDRCPVPWLEATAILDADYHTAAPLSLVELVRHGQSIQNPTSPLGLFAQAVLESFVGSDADFAVALSDKDWRHTRITLAQGGEPCRVLIGAAGVRLAFTPDFLEGVL